MSASIRLEPATRDGITLTPAASGSIEIERLAPDAPMIKLQNGPRGADGERGGIFSEGEIRDLATEEVLRDRYNYLPLINQFLNTGL